MMASPSITVAAVLSAFSLYRMIGVLIVARDGVIELLVRVDVTLEREIRSRPEPSGGAHSNCSFTFRQEPVQSCRKNVRILRGNNISRYAFSDDLGKAANVRRYHRPPHLHRLDGDVSERLPRARRYDDHSGRVDNGRDDVWLNPSCEDD